MPISRTVALQHQSDFDGNNNRQPFTHTMARLGMDFVIEGDRVRDLALTQTHPHDLDRDPFVQKMSLFLLILGQRRVNL